MLSWELTYKPRTELGNKLLQIRVKAVRAGLKLLSEDEVLEAIRRRRELRCDDDPDVRGRKRFDRSIPRQ